jgi:hypothetical protein
MTIEKSDSAKVVCWSRETVDFYVFARQLMVEGDVVFLSV